MSISNKPILITGSNRSGSTWVGKVIGEHRKVLYFHEPFNVIMAETGYGRELPRWFIHAPDWDETYLRDYISTVLTPPHGAYWNNPPSGPAESFLRFAKATVRKFVFKHRILIKDPVALFSTDWLVDTFGFIPVIIVRHPASYVLSVRNDPSHMHSFRSVFIEQPRLISRFTPEDIDLIHAVVELQENGSGGNIVFEAAVFWRLFHRYILQFRDQLGDAAVLIKYEDLATDPLGGFQDLFRRVGLSWSPSAGKKIRETALVKGRDNMDLSSHVKSFDSSKNISRWKADLSKGDIEEVRSVVEPVSCQFYGEEDW
ncbi:MAG: sulfotransferase [Opitutales bacterium]|jgi:hypothetical protein